MNHSTGKKQNRVSRRMRNNSTTLLLAGAIAAFATAAQAGELIQDVAGTKLRVALSVKQARWVMGSAVSLEAVVTNLDSAPLRIDAFGELNALYQGKHKGSFIASCWSLAWEPEAAPAGPQPGKAPLSADQLILLDAGEAFTKPLSWAVKDIAPGRYRVRLAYSPRVASPSFNFPENWLRQQAIAEPIWTGMIFSEPVDVEVVANQ